MLQSVHSRGAKLGAQGAPAQVTLELPALPPPATGSFPVAQAPLPTVALPGAGVVMSPPVATVSAPAAPPEPPQTEPAPVPPPPGVPNPVTR
jgi:general secretion pathway protein C